MPVIRYRVPIAPNSSTEWGPCMTRVSAAAERSFAFAVGRERRAKGRGEERLAMMRGRVRRTMGYAGPIAAALILIVIAAVVTWRLEYSRIAALEPFRPSSGSARRRTRARARQRVSTFRRRPTRKPRSPRRSAATPTPSARRCCSTRKARSAPPRPTASTRRRRSPRRSAAMRCCRCSATSPGRCRSTSAQGVDSFAALRTLAHGRGQVVLIASEREMLAGWRANARVLTALLAAVVLILAGATTAFWLDALQAREKAKLAAQSRAHLDLALRHGRCGLWNWDLDSGRIDLVGVDVRSARRARAPTGFCGVADVAPFVHPSDPALEEIAAAAPLGAARAVRRSAAGCAAPTASGFGVDQRADIVESEARAPPADRHRRRRHRPHARGGNLRRPPTSVCATPSRRSRKPSCFGTPAIAWCCATPNISTCTICRWTRRAPAPPTPNWRGSARRRSSPTRSSSAPTTPAPRDERSRTYQARLDDGRWLQVNERRTRDGGFVSVGTDITAIKQNEEELQKSERLLLQTVAQLNQSRRSLEAQAQQMAGLAKGYLEEKAKAETANRAKAEFLANMGHELRTPLNAIIGFSDMMRSETLGPMAAKYLDYASNIFDSGQSLLKVFDDVLGHVEPRERPHSAQLRDVRRQRGGRGGRRRRRRRGARQGRSSCASTSKPTRRCKPTAPRSRAC